MPTHVNIRIRGIHNSKKGIISNINRRVNKLYMHTLKWHQSKRNEGPILVAYSVMLALRNLRQEDCKSKISLGYSLEGKRRNELLSHSNMVKTIVRIWSKIQKSTYCMALYLKSDKFIIVEIRTVVFWRAGGRSNRMQGNFSDWRK
jgi:hypothetical protein